MKMLLKNSFLLYVIIFINMLNAQNLTYHEMLEFYPNNLGNSWSYWWIYYDQLIDYSETGRDVVVISQDTTINNINYWLFEYYYRGFEDPEVYLERIDSTTGDVLRIYDISFGVEHRVDNLYAQVGDTISISDNRYLLYCDKMVVLSIRDTILNDFKTTIREVVGLPYLNKLFFARNIGLLGSGKNYWIDSAIVNGTIFTDISSDITDVKEDDETIVNSFFLYQNYPNPFNPITTIKYDLLKSSLVTIKIYDVIGREIEILVSGNKSPGSYFLQFNGSNLPSGIYYYQIKTENFIETKKMVLLK